MEKSLLIVGFLLVLMSMFAFNASAINHYITPGNGAAPDSTASNCIINWSTTCNALPNTLTRGDTYFIADGTLPGRTFNTAASGTQYITIKKAVDTTRCIQSGLTAAECRGTDAGWSDTMGDGQTIWSSGLIFSTSYWIFDGQVSPKWYEDLVGSKDQSKYGFRFNIISGRLIQVYNTASVMSNVRVSHVAGKAISGDVEKYFLPTNDETQSVHDVTLSYSLIDGFSNTIWATSANKPMNNWLVEHNVILNGYSSSAIHGEDINNNYGYLDNLTVRYNWFEGRGPSTASIVCLNGACGPYHIYGNVWYKNPVGGQGIISGVHFPISGEIYNNVFIDTDSYAKHTWIGVSVNSVKYNNIIYDSNAARPIISGGSNSNYNAFFTAGSTYPTEANSYKGTGDPFVNLANGDLSLKPSVAAAMPAGFSLGAQFARDVAGTIRGIDGKWDRGALEYTSGPLNANCGSSANTCNPGTVFNQSVNSSSFVWECLGTNSGQNKSCSVLLSPIAGACGLGLDICSIGSYLNLTDNSTTFLWQCTGLYNGTNLICGFVKPKFVIGDRVYVSLNNSADPLWIRDSAAGSYLGTQPFNALGTIIGGPNDAPLGGTVYRWWNVNFDSGTDGWTTQTWLENYNQYHPADLNFDFTVSLNEFTNYSSYFKLARAWPFAPSPPDANYYSRAYFLLKRGFVEQGAYSYNASAGCPGCFITR